MIQIENNSQNTTPEFDPNEESLLPIALASLRNYVETNTLKNELHEAIEAMEAMKLELYEEREKTNLEREKGRRDILTGLFNQGAFEEKYQSIFENIEDNQVMFMYFDLDKFKQLNDTHGHDEGDKALKLFSEIMIGVLDDVVRKDDVFAARKGGDEFAVIIEPEAKKNDENIDGRRNHVDMNAMKSRIQTELVRRTIDTKMQGLGVSIGFASFREEGFEEETPLEFRKRVDSRLYHDKETKDSRNKQILELVKD